MQQFDTPSPITAVLHVPAGRVRFVATDRTDTTVEISPANPSKARDTKAAEQTTVDYADGVLRIETAIRNQYLGPTGALDVTVNLPAGSHVEAKTAATELRTAGRLGNVAFEGAHRRIQLDEIGTLRLTATDGDVEIGRLTGPAHVTTARGDIQIAEAVRDTVVLATQSGDISITAAAGVSAALDAGTTHGRITNALKNNGTAELDIHATTANGDITAVSL